MLVWLPFKDSSKISKKGSVLGSIGVGDLLLYNRVLRSAGGPIIVLHRGCKGTTKSWKPLCDRRIQGFRAWGFGPAGKA